MDAQTSDSTARQTPAPGSNDSLIRARRGDLAAFRELLALHRARVYSIALRITGQHADAEELAQDVFLQLHGALAGIESDAHLKHWLLRTVTHRCIDHLRKGARRPRLVAMDTLPEGTGPASESADDPLLASHARRLLLQLAPEARAVLLLRFQEDLDPSDIASVLAMPVNTVKSHLRRSLEWMRAQLAGDDHAS